MGIALDSDSVPVTRATNCIIAATKQETRRDAAALPCIRCSECSTACPAYLMPQELHRAAEHDRLDVLENLGLFDCIECGCCDVVCPSHIPLTETFRAGKHRLVHAMDHEARVRWLDSREQLRRQRIEHWEEAHDSSVGAGRAPPTRRRLEAVADIIERVSRLAEPA